MKIGVIYPQGEMGDPAALDAIGRATEALGYDYFLMFDHVLGAVHEGRTPPLAGPYTEHNPFQDPLVTLGYLAAVTKRIELVTGVLILPQRQTALVARQAADVDLLSGGRLRLGVGSGWNYVEYDALGQDFHARGKRMDEQIPLLRRLWSEPVVSFEGTFDHIDRAALIPRPMRQIPIYCGGFTEPAYRRAARLADGFIFSAKLEERVIPGWQRLRELLAAQRRPVDGFGAEYLSAGGLSAAQVVDQIRRWQDVGGTHAGIRTLANGFTTAQQHIDFLAEVRHKLR